MYFYPRMDSVDFPSMVEFNPENSGPSASNKKLLLVVTERDIVFNCPNCEGELVVDLAGAGMECPCSHCGKILVVPAYRAGPAASPIGVTLLSHDRLETPPAASRHFDFEGHAPEQLERRLGELTHQLKENRSQDTEMRGHVNRATMELHRLQLRLKKLQERQVDIEAELDALRTKIGHQSS